MFSQRRKILRSLYKRALPMALSLCLVTMVLPITLAADAAVVNDTDNPAFSVIAYNISARINIPFISDASGYKVYLSQSAYHDISSLTADPGTRCVLSSAAYKPYVYACNGDADSVNASNTVSISQNTTCYFYLVTSDGSTETLQSVFKTSTKSADDCYWTSTGHYDISWYKPDAVGYKISTEAQLAGLAVLNNGLKGVTAVDFSGKNITIAESLDLSAYLWTPIGTEARPFRGNVSGIVYDTGSGKAVSCTHTIKGLHTNTTNNYQGLFGVAGGTSRISDIGALDGYVKGNLYTAGIVGCFEGTAIHNSYNTCSVNSKSGTAGGIAGCNMGNINNCYNIGSITGTYDTGGVAGYSEGAMLNCYNTGSVSGYEYVGGVVGCIRFSKSRLYTCYNTGTVTASYMEAGGITGCSELCPIDSCYNSGSVYSANYAAGIVGAFDYRGYSLSNCYNNGSINGNYRIGGICSIFSGDSIDNCYNAGNVAKIYNGGEITAVIDNGGGTVNNCYYNSDTAYSIAVGNIYGIGKTSTELKALAGTLGTAFVPAPSSYVANGIFSSSNPVNGGYPVLTAFGYTGGSDIDSQFEKESGTGCYLIKNAYQLDLVRNYCDNSKSGIVFNLTGNIDLSKAAYNNFNLCWQPIGSDSKPFCSMFDGNGYSISGITISGWNSYRGLFGYNSGTIEKLGVTDVNITSWQDAGGIVGYNTGIISNCSSAGILCGIILGIDIGGIAGNSQGDGSEVSGCSNACTVMGGGWIGGIVGYSWSVVSDCSNTGFVIGIKFSYSPGEAGQIGGIVGINATHSMMGCHNKGTVCGNKNIGGIAGYITNIDGEVSGCSNTGSVFGKSQSGGIVGYIRVSNILKNCHNEGTIIGYTSESTDIGGIAGQADSKIQNCYNTGAVTGNSAVGGVTGSFEYVDASYCSNTGTIAGMNGIGGIAGNGRSFTAQYCYNTGTVSSKNISGGIVGTDVSVDYEKTTIECCYSTGCIQGSTAGGLIGSSMSPDTIRYSNYAGCDRGIGNSDDRDGSIGPFVKLASSSVKAAGTTSIIQQNDISKAYFYMNQLGPDFTVSFSAYQSDNADVATVSDLTVTGGKVGTTTITGTITITQNELNMQDTDGFTGKAKTITVPVSISLTVIKATPAVAANVSSNSVTVGDMMTLTAVISSAYAPTGTVTFYNSGKSVGLTNTIINGVATINYVPTSIDSLSITAAYGGDGNNTSAVSSNTQNVTMAKRSPVLTTVTAAPSSQQSYPVTSVSLLTVLSNYYGKLSGQTISFYNGKFCIGTATTDENGTAVYTLVNPVADTYQFTARFGGDSNNNNAETCVSTAYTINKGTQASLSIDGIPSCVTYGDSSFTLSPSGGSGTNNNYTYFSENNGVLSVDSNGRVSIKGAGTAVITVTKAGDRNYNSISKDISIIVYPKTLDVIITPNNKQYDATTEASTLKIEYSGIVGTDDVCITDGKLSFSNQATGDNKQVTSSGYTVGGEKAADYLLGIIDVKNANITKKKLSVSVKPVIISCGQSISSLSVEVSGFVSDENENNVVGFVKPAAKPVYNSPTTTAVTEVPLNVAYLGGNASNNYEFSYSYTTGLTIHKVTVKDGDYRVSGKFALSENPADWNDKNFTITPCNGYNLISTDGSAWVSKLTVSTEGKNGSVTFKLKKTTNGMQTEGKTMYYNLDKTLPTIRITGNPINLVKSAKLTILAKAGCSGIKSIMVNGKNITDTYKNGYTVTRNGDYRFSVTNGAGVTFEQVVKVSEIEPALITDIKAGLTFDLSNVALPSDVTSVSVKSTVLPESGTGSEYYGIVKGLIGGSNLGSLSSLAVYQVKLLDQNSKQITNFTGKIKVMFPIPADVSGVPHIFWYNPENGTLTDMNAIKENGNLVFETTHSGYYAVAALKSVNTSVPNPPSGGRNTLIFLLVLIGVGTIGLVVLRKRMKYRVKK